MRCHRLYLLVWSILPFILMTPPVSSPLLQALIAHWRYLQSLPTVCSCIYFHVAVECSTMTFSPPGNNSLITPFSYITSLPLHLAFPKSIINQTTKISGSRDFEMGWHQSGKGVHLTLSLHAYTFICAGVSRWFGSHPAASPTLLYVF